MYLNMCLYLYLYLLLCVRSVFWYFKFNPAPADAKTVLHYLLQEQSYSVRNVEFHYSRLYSVHSGTEESEQRLRTELTGYLHCQTNNL